MSRTELRQNRRTYAGPIVEAAYDDVSGAKLEPSAVHAARKTEMGFFEDMGVYERSKIIGPRWIDTNKGDSINPRIRSRLVGKEFRTGPDDALYASTPPLEALRLVLSKAATVVEGEEKNDIMINDVSRAYFYAKSTRCMYIEIPPEDPKTHPDDLGRLRLCLYGIRDAALNWQRTLSDHLVENGFVRVVGHPSVFHHPKRQIWTLVHGDDYCSSGSAASLDWLQGVLEKRYEIKTQRFGDHADLKGEKKLKGGQVLNMVVRRTRSGLEHEADLRHAEVIIEQLGIEKGKFAGSPGVEMEISCAACSEEPEGRN